MGSSKGKTATDLLGFDAEWKAMVEPCEGCAYLMDGWHVKYCDYLTITGHRRPCKGGAECKVKVTKGVKRKKWIDF